MEPFNKESIGEDGRAGSMAGVRTSPEHEAGKAGAWGRKGQKNGKKEAGNFLERIRGRKMVKKTRNGIAKME